MTKPIVQRIVAVLERLSDAQQAQVLRYVESMANSASERPKGVPGKAFRDLAGCMSKEDAEEMLRIIEEGCGLESINMDRWKKS